MDALSPALLKILDSNFNGSFAKRGLTSRLHFTPPDVKTRRELMGQWASTLLIYLCSGNIRVQTENPPQPSKIWHLTTQHDVALFRHQVSLDIGDATLNVT